MPCKDGPFRVVERVNENSYKLDLLGEYGVSTTFNVADLSPFAAGDDLDLRTNHFQEEGNDVIPPEAVPSTTCWGADSIWMKTGPITRAQAKRLKDNLAAFIQGVFQSQEGLPILEDSRHVLSIQVVEAGKDPGSGFSVFM